MSVNEEQALEEAELQTRQFINHKKRVRKKERTNLRDRIVGRVDGLETFLARDSDADVRGLDHAHVVRAVADSERHGAGDTVLYELHDERLLLGGDTAADDRLAERAEAQKQVLMLSVCETL